MTKKVRLFRGDCLKVLKKIPDGVIDAVVTDPPYGISFMGKKWDYDVPSVKIWKQVYRVLKPGGHILVFSGARTYHRMVCNIEDAGFEIRDQIMWLYGKGFPKSRDLSKDIDRIKGAKRKVVGTYTVPGFAESNVKQGAQRRNVYEFKKLSKKAVTEEAKQWKGWGTALKPAHEPIVLARKPLIGTMAENVLKHSTGGLNIDATRVKPTGERLGGGAEKRATFEGKKGWGRPWMSDKEAVEKATVGHKERVEHATKKGRWPANVIHDGSKMVCNAFPAEQEFPSSAARFFYSAKASNADRTEDGQVDNDHPTVKPTSLMVYLCKLITPPNGWILDPFMGSGSTGKAARMKKFRFVGIERSRKSFRIAKKRIRIAHKMSRSLFEE